MISLSSYRFVCSLFILLLLAGNAFCQLSFQVLDLENKNPIANVLITNKRTKIDTRSDAQGNFNMDIDQVDTLLFSHPAYNFSVQYVYAGKHTLYLTPKVHKLQEVEVKSDMAKFREDSAFRQSVYHKTLHDAKQKPKAGFSNGVVVDGLFSSLANKISGKGKKNKEFVKQLAADDKERYLKVRYSKNLVERVTPLRGDSVQLFIDHFPVDYDFARNATDLEFDSWVRNNYKSWLGIK